MKFILFLFLPSVSFANIPNENLVAISQGIASPNVTSLVNLGRGFLASENPAGVMYQNGMRASLEYAKDGTSDAGVEVGGTGHSFGGAAGIYNPGCSGCKSRTAVDLGASLSNSIDGGLRYETSNSVPTYGLGFIFNSKNENRFGVDVTYLDTAASASRVTSYGVGYANVDSQSTISIEASEQSSPGNSSSGTYLSLGYARRSGSLQVSMTYETNTSVSNSDAFWMGAGFKGDTWVLSIYSNYDLQMLAVVSAFF